MVKIQELKTGQLLITIPRAIAQAKGFKKGMELEFIIDNLGNLILRPKA
jgi:antitoxin component of MazEF toxin-antitoxin module